MFFRPKKKLPNKKKFRNFLAQARLGIFFFKFGLKVLELECHETDKSAIQKCLSY